MASLTTAPNPIEMAIAAIWTSADPPLVSRCSPGMTAALKRSVRPRMSHAPAAPARNPDKAIPNVADASAIAVAPPNPARSSDAPKAMDVAGPPARDTAPAATPTSGFKPTARATAIPRAFCSTAPSVASPSSVSTCTPPRRSSDKLAFRPMMVNTTSMNRSRSVVSTVKFSHRSWSTHTVAAKKKPARDRGRHAQAIQQRKAPGHATAEQNSCRREAQHVRGAERPGSDHINPGPRASRVRPPASSRRATS